MLTYGARGAGDVWRALRPDRRLAALVGRSRARLLDHLDLPATTTGLAVTLGLSAPAVSRHLGVLESCGLVTAWRAGRTVLYQRTELARTMLDAPAAGRRRRG